MRESDLMVNNIVSRTFSFARNTSPAHPCPWPYWLYNYPFMPDIILITIAIIAVITAAYGRRIGGSAMFVVLCSYGSRPEIGWKFMGQMQLMSLWQDECLNNH